DAVAPGECPRRPDRHHDSLGAGVGEADLLHRRVAPAHDPGEPALQPRGRRENETPGELKPDGLLDDRVPVAMDQARVVGEEVEIPVAVDILDHAALAQGQSHRVGREECGGPRVACWHRLVQGREETRRAWRSLSMLGDDLRSHRVAGSYRSDDPGAPGRVGYPGQ